MAFAVWCRDTRSGDPQGIRARELRPHLDYVATLGPRLLVAGPLQLAGAEPFDGSLFVYDVATEAEARELLTGDPYFKAGLYESITVSAFIPARGRWLDAAPPE